MATEKLNASNVSAFPPRTPSKRRRAKRSDAIAQGAVAKVFKLVAVQRTPAPLAPDVAETVKALGIS